MANHVGSGQHAHGCVCASCCDENDHHREHANGDNDATYASSTGGIGAGLISGYKWSDAELTVAYTNSSKAYSAGAAAAFEYGSGEAVAGFAPLTAAQRKAANFAFDQFEAVSGLSFTKVSGADQANATIRLAQSAEPTTAWGYYPSGAPEGGDAWFGTRFGYYDSPVKGDYAWHTMLHEIGHTLGLKHGHESNAGGALPWKQDSMEYSVMTYRSFVGDPMHSGYSNESFGFAQSLMQADIAALQQMYGANYDHNADDTIYRFNAKTGEMFINGEGQGAPGDNRIFLTIWDGGGEDTLNFANYRENTQIDLRPGAGSIADRDQLVELNGNAFGFAAPVFASANVYLAQLHEGDRRAFIENAIGGSGDDRVFGNGGDNRLNGMRGDDTLSGGWGADRLLGGDGDDRLFGGAGRDKLIAGRGEDRLAGGGGNDRLFGWGGDDTLGGGAQNDILIGGAGNDVLFGGSGRDILVGAAGGDRIIGGQGDDRLQGGGEADVFVFNQWSGDDRILDFTVGVDRLDVSAFNTRFAGLNISQSDDGALIEIGRSSIKVDGVDANEIGFQDFLF